MFKKNRIFFLFSLQQSFTSKEKGINFIKFIKKNAYTNHEYLPTTIIKIVKFCATYLIIKKFNINWQDESAKLCLYLQ